MRPRFTFVIPDHDQLVLLIRAAGAFHFVTLTLACFTPIPPDWDANLAALPETHRRFAIAQNVFIGGVIAVLGLISLGLAGELATPSPLARAVGGITALWWGGRLLVLPWLKVTPHLKTPALRAGFLLLRIQCALYALFYGWLALRPA